MSRGFEERIEECVRLSITMDAKKKGSERRDFISSLADPYVKEAFFEQCVSGDHINSLVIKSNEKASYLAVNGDTKEKDVVTISYKPSSDKVEMLKEAFLRGREEAFLTSLGMGCDYVFTTEADRVGYSYSEEENKMTFALGTSRELDGSVVLSDSAKSFLNTAVDLISTGDKMLFREANGRGVIPYESGRIILSEELAESNPVRCQVSNKKYVK